jgi:hypothetical protein
VRLEDNILETVVFIGFATEDPGKGGIDCIGTAFCFGTVIFLIW